jgi:hypothetical protein
MPHGTCWIIAASVTGLLAMGLPAPVGAQEKMPIIDTHVHYSRPAWEVFPPPVVLEKLAAAGVARAMVSSTPDDGTLMLFRADPTRIVPVLRPYRTRADMADWFASDAVLAYMKSRLEGGPYIGIGEFHLNGAANARTPQIREITRLALERNLMLHAHSDAEAVRALFEVEPRLRIHWAHSGFESAEVIGEMMDRYRRLTADVSFRAGNIGAGGELNPVWRDLLIRHQDRFMIGSDTYVNSQWDSYGGIIASHRDWLGKLPRGVAAAIAHGNAEREFGIGLKPALGQ